jgi:hypothetical protein
MLTQKKLEQAQAQFFMRYPGGFENPEMIEVGKKHRMNKMVATAKALFSVTACSNVNVTAANMVKVVSRSSMVSMFEKPKYRDFVKSLNESDKAFMVNALSNMIHSRSSKKQQSGFEALVDLLSTEKLAKWSLITIIPAYYAPNKEVFVKPTTAKNVLRHFDVEDPVYKPAPSWDFYHKYRQLINHAKTKVDKSLSPSNAAFTGFLMMAVKS